MGKKKKIETPQPIPQPQQVIICPSCQTGIMMRFGKEYQCPDCGYIGCADCGTL